MPTPPASSVAASVPVDPEAPDCREPRGPIIAASIGVVGAAAVAWLAHTLSKRREALARFAAASKEFRNAFSEELAFLESNAETYDLPTYLLRAYDAKHRAALITFEHFIPEAERKRFRAAWHQYHSGQQAGGEPLDMFDMGSSYNEAMFIEYMGHPFSHPTMNARQLAAHRIRTLFQFARFA